MKRGKSRSPEAIKFARSQRRTSNEFASTVWQWLKSRRMHGVKFRHEYPIPPYTVDFCCLELMLVIEIDGATHYEDQGKRHDQARDSFLKRRGYRILRVPGYSVIREDGDACKTIEAFVRDAKATMQNPSPPAPLPEAGRGGPEGMGPCNGK